MSDQIVAATRRWIEQVVIGLNLCPFAKRELVRGALRFQVSAATHENQLIEELSAELKLLEQDESIETTLLIHPDVLDDFLAYNDFLARADRLLKQEGYEGDIQIASFHPEYQFAGTGAADAENYTNRSPYPMLHLLRERSLDDAIDRYPDVSGIPEQNIKTMNRMGADELKALLSQCQSVG